MSSQMIILAEIWGLPLTISSIWSGWSILLIWGLLGDILYSFCQDKKVKKNKIFKNNELKTGPLFRNTSPSDSVHGFVFDFDEFLANNEL